MTTQHHVNHDVAAVGRHALARIKMAGWAKGTTAPEGAFGPMCLGATLMYQETGIPAISTGFQDTSPACAEVAQIIREQFPDRVSVVFSDIVPFGPVISRIFGSASHTIVSFNDHADTTIEDIKLVLEKLAAREQAP